MTTIMNARISSCLLGFFFPEFADGLNFAVHMELELANKHICMVEMNPVKIPMLLELLDVRGFNMIEGQYIQVKFEGNKRPNFIKPILATDSDEWFKLDNDIYFGSRIWGGENEKK